jgi:hypothetical protein
MSTVTTSTIIGMPEVVEDARQAETSAAWTMLRDAATALQAVQVTDGSVPDPADHEVARSHVEAITAGIRSLAPAFPHDEAYLDASVADFER